MIVAALLILFNQFQISSISGIVAININTLANHLKIKAVPGEALYIKLLHLGKDPSQGVGYLDDGTMVVVEGGADLVGKTAEVLVHRVLQTEAGKMIFARRAN